ncbi:MAG TPA: sigma-70 family RNA polymerase sigma factor [Acidimicrobiia bacterium]|nr:sigma-70 family RNA polymerase sigma factor [Acidimicrobiia bacterium]HEX2404593.1 sigma-70 family RNA polymerase sigma factor [Acidimicrobiia bacterium]
MTELSDDTQVGRTDPQLRFDAVFKEHHGAIYRYCLRRLGRSDAEDAASDVFAVAWRRLDEMPTGERSRAWLFGIAYRVVGNQYRSRRRRTSLASRLAALGTGRDRVVEEPSPVGEVEMLLLALDGLSSADRELLRLSSWDGLTRSDIAYVVGIKENAVDQRLHRARSRLKRRFDLLNVSPSSPESEEAPT